jgi:hypothetical protein
MLDERFRGGGLSFAGDSSKISESDGVVDVDNLLAPFPNLNGGSWLSTDRRETPQFVEYALVRDIDGRRRLGLRFLNTH